jgi:hypothetical protein
MNGEVIKSIISGGDKQTCRETGGKIQHFTLDIVMFVNCNNDPIITPADNAIKGRVSVFRPPNRYVKQPELDSSEAASNWRLEDPLIKEKVKTAAMKLGLVELLVKSYELNEPTPPSKIAADTLRMLDNNKSYEPVKNIDLKPFVEYTGKLGDFVTFQDVMQAIEDQGTGHVDPKIVSAALLDMGQFVSKKRARVPGHDGQVMRYEGLKKRLFESSDNEEATGSIESINRIHDPVAEDD